MLKLANATCIVCIQNPLCKSNIEDVNESIGNIFTTIGDIPTDRLIKDVKKSFENNFVTFVNNSKVFHNENFSDNVPIVYFDIDSRAHLMPKICDKSNGLDIPLQSNLYLQPGELAKVNLMVRFQFPKHYCALLMNKSSARIKYNIQIQLGLIDVGFSDFLQTVVQNMSSEPIRIPSGTALVQLLFLKSKIPTFEKAWPETEISRGSFGSTGQSFETIEKATLNNAFLQIKLNTSESQFVENCTSESNCHPVHFHIDAKQILKHPVSTLENTLNPKFFTLECFHVNLPGSPV